MGSHIMQEMETAPFLQRVIRGNALYCSTAGLGLIFFAGTVAGWLGIGASWIIILLGVVMVTYAAVLAWGAGRRPWLWGLIATDLDILWIIGSLFVLFTDWLSLTRAGVWAVALAADGVFIFVILQIIGLRRFAARNKRTT